MNVHGSHIYQLARPCGFQHERPCANAGFGTQKAFVSVHRWHHPGREMRKTVAQAQQDAEMWLDAKKAVK